MLKKIARLTLQALNRATYGDPVFGTMMVLRHVSRVRASRTGSTFCPIWLCWDVRKLAEKSLTKIHNNQRRRTIMQLQGEIKHEDAEIISLLRTGGKSIWR